MEAVIDIDVAVVGPDVLRKGLGPLPRFLARLVLHAHVDGLGSSQSSEPYQQWMGSTISRRKPGRIRPLEGDGRPVSVCGL